MVYSNSVSVIIPHYNNPKLLFRAIDSALTQDTRPKEIIVVDDASTVAWDIPEQMLASGIVKVIRETSNRGAAHCRNVGIEAATGDLIAFLDADDIWTPYKLSRCVEALETRSNSNDHVVLFSNILLVDEAGRRAGNVTPYAGGSISDFILLNKGYVQTSSIVMRRRDYPTISFDGFLRRHQDWDFAINAEARGAEFVYLDETLVEYHVGNIPGRMTRSVEPGPSFEFLNKYEKTLSQDQVIGFISGSLIRKKLNLSQRVWLCRKVLGGDFKTAKSMDLIKIVAVTIIGASTSEKIREFLKLG